MGRGQTDEALRRLAATALPRRITVRSPEGFAHYGVYPEACLLGAGRLPAGRPVRVVGLRSIGTTLAAAVAAGLDRASATVTLRPVGHPFARTVSAAPSLLGPAGPDEIAVVVDEGPGLSGSSVAAAVHALEAQGYGPDRVHLMPSHAGGPGPEAGEAVRAAWARCRRHVVTFDDLVLRAEDPAHRLEAWCRDLVGAPLGPPVEISGGGWRDIRPGPRPPAQRATERRKLLVETATGSWCLRFAGIGRSGLRKLALARSLHAAGFVPEPAGFRHGFLVERWLAGARPLDLARDRPALLHRLGDYLAARATLPPGPLRGACCADLLRMAARNAELALGPGRASPLERWRRDLDRLESRRRPVAQDGRLQAWEWIVEPDGRILKTDAVDHHAAHDLVGPQDIGWDLAGAAVEFALSEAEEEALVGRVAASAAVDRGLLGFLRVCYAAFQLGSWTLARDGEADPAERAALGREVARYAHALVTGLQTDNPAG